MAKSKQPTTTKTSTQHNMHVNPTNANSKSKSFIIDTNIPINYTGHIVNLAKDKENVAMIFPDIMLAEFDNVKRKVKDKSHSVYEASAFINQLLQNTKRESVPLSALDIKFPGTGADYKAQVIDFSLQENKQLLKKFAKQNQIFNDKIEGKVAFMPIRGLVDNIADKQSLEEHISKNTTFDIDLGTYDKLLSGLTVLANNERANQTKLISLDHNLRSSTELNCPNSAEAPTGGLKLSSEKYQGYKILNWTDLVAKSYLEEFKTDVMRMSPNGFKLDLNKVNKDTLESLYTQDYLLFVDDKDNHDFFKRKEDGEDIPNYNLPQLNHVARFRQNDVDDYSMFSLDKRITKPDMPSWLSNFQIKSFEGLLFLDSMFQDNNLYILHGEAGTGKTFSALYVALAETLYKQSQGIKNPSPKLMINKPLVGLNDEKVGFLPGDLYDKYGPFLDSLHETFELIKPDIGKNIFGNASLKEIIDGTDRKNKDLIELKSSPSIRGLSIQKNFTFLSDEFQNYSPNVGLQLLPRLGPGKMLLAGDPLQTDGFGIDKGYNAMREIMVRNRSDLEYHNKDQFKRDLDLQNNTRIIHFQNFLRSKQVEAIMHRYHGLSR